MYDWENMQARIDATWDFCRWLRNHPEDKQPCKDNSDYAKGLYAKNYFYLSGDSNNPPGPAYLTPIPSDVEFRIYEKDDANAGKLVTIVLPDDSTHLPIPTYPANGVWSVWRCTYILYTTLEATGPAAATDGAAK